jgi:TIR domain/Tetratricopeptide repeat
MSEPVQCCLPCSTNRRATRRRGGDCRVTEDEHSRVDFFISYTDADAHSAEWIADTLLSAGYTIIFQKWDFLEGESLPARMQDAILRADHVIAVISPDYLEPGGLRHLEWQTAIVSDVSGAKRKLLAIIVRQVDAATLGLIATRIWLDLTRDEPDAARTKLLAAADPRERRLPDSPIAFPGVTGTSAQKMRVPLANVDRVEHDEFMGRVSELTWIREQLAPDARAIALTGLGGVGKSRVAYEYAIAREDHYGLIWRMSCSSQTEFSASLAGLAAALGSIVPGASGAAESHQIEDFAAALKRREPCLILAEDLADPTLLKALMPLNVRCHVIATCRDATIELPSFEVRTFDRQQSVQFLVRGQSAASDESAVEELAIELGGLPLALTQARAYVRNTGVSFVEYLSLFRGRTAELLAEPQPGDYPATVATTWSLSFDALRRDAVDAVALIEFLAVLAPSPVPRILFGYLSTPPVGVARLSDPMVANAAIAAARRFSLVEVDGSSVWLHNLVSVVVGLRLAARGSTSMTLAAIESMSAMLETLPDGIVLLLPHAMRVVSTGVGSREVPAAFSQVALATSELLANVVPPLGRAFADLANETIANWESPDNATLRRAALATARAVGASGDQRGALPFVTTALRLTPDRHPLRTYTLCLYVGSLRHHGDKEARSGVKLVAKEVGKVRAAEPPDEESLASLLRTLGMTEHIPLGRLRQARGHLQEAFEIRSRLFGPGHHLTAGAASDLALVLADLDELDEAVSVLGASIVASDGNFGSTISLTAQLSNLGMIHYRRREYSEAVEALDRAVTIRRELMGDSLATALAERNLGEVVLDSGDSKRALELLETSRARMSRLGRSFPSDAQALLDRAAAETGSQPMA